MARKQFHERLEERIRQLEEEVAERKRVEETLQIQKAYLEHLLESAPDAIVLADRTHRITRINDQFTHLFHFAPEEASGRIGDDLIAPAERYYEASNITRRVSHGEIVRVETVRCRKDGSLIAVELMAAPVRVGGEYIGDYVSYRDITERKRAEEKLRKSEERWQFALEGAGDGVWDWNAVKNEVFFSRQWKTMLGFEDHEIGNTLDEWDKRVHPEDRDRVRIDINKHFSGETLVYVNEHRVRCKDGTYKWILDRGKVISWTPEGKPLRAIGTHTDISEQKRIQAELIDNRQVLDSILSASAVAIAYARDRKIVWANEAMVNLFGFTGEEDCIGKDTLILYATEEEYMRIGKLTYEMPPGKVLETEAVFRRQDDGNEFYGHVKVNILDPSNPKKGIIVNILDITERKRAEEALKESEERYRTAIEHSNDGIAIVEGDTHIFVNQKFIDIFGYDRPEEIVGKSISHCVHPNDRERVKEMNRKRQAGEPVASRYEFKGVRKDGKVLQIEVSATGTTYRGRRVSLVSLRDVTDRKRGEEEKEKLQAQLLQAQKLESVGRLAGGVAHDFNNMLGVIVGNVELAMLDTGPGKPTYTHLKEISNAAQRSADLVRQLLAFARKQTVSPKVLDLNNTVSSMIAMLRRLIGENIELLWMPGYNLWPVKIDPSQIDQILANLAVNARDAISGVGKLTIETANRVLDMAFCDEHPGAFQGESVQLTVSDTGAGMSKDVFEHLFEPFYTTKEVGRGTGLGLATVYGIVKQNNGFINVSSEPGRGTTIRVYLPKWEAEVGTAEKKPDEGRIPEGSETVMLAEDDESLLTVAREILKKQGYTVLAAKTPIEALSIAAKHDGKIDLMLTDVVMPEMNGRELMEKLHAIRPEMKALFMSGYTADVVAHHGVLDEGIFFIEKPFSPRALAEKVREVLDRGRGSS